RARGRLGAASRLGACGGLASAHTAPHRTSRAPARRPGRGARLAFLPQPARRPLLETDGTTTAQVGKTDPPAGRGTPALLDPNSPSAPAPAEPSAPSPPDPVALAQEWADQFQHLTTISLAGAGGMLILVETGGLRA